MILDFLLFAAQKVMIIWTKNDNYSHFHWWRQKFGDIKNQKTPTYFALAVHQ